MRYFSAEYSPIGLDLQEHAVYAIQFTRSRRGIRLHAWGRASIDQSAYLASGHHATISAIRSLIDANEFHGNFTYGTIPSSQLEIRPISVRGSLDDARESLPSASQFSSYIPYPMETAVYSFVPFHEEQGGTAGNVRGLLVSTRKEHANHRLALLSAAGLDCVGLDTRMTSASRMLAPVGGFQCLLDLGMNTTEIVLRKGKEIVFVRTLRTGLDRFIKTLVDALGLDEETARRVLRRFPLAVDNEVPVSSGSPWDTEHLGVKDLHYKLRRVLEPPLAVLASELEQTFQYVAIKGYASGIEKINVFGELAPRQLGLFLAHALGRDVANGNICEAVPAWPGESGLLLSQYATSAGLALRGWEV